MMSGVAAFVRQLWAPWMGLLSEDYWWACLPPISLAKSAISQAVPARGFAHVFMRETHTPTQSAWLVLHCARFPARVSAVHKPRAACMMVLEVQTHKYAYGVSLAGASLCRIAGISWRCTKAQSYMMVFQLHFLQVWTMQACWPNRRQLQLPWRSMHSSSTMEELLGLYRYLRSLREFLHIFETGGCCVRLREKWKFVQCIVVRTCLCNATCVCVWERCMVLVSEGTIHWINLKPFIKVCLQ